MSAQSDDQNTNQNPENQKPAEKVSIFKSLLSAIAAMFGIQSQENLERDFKKGSATNFIIVGIFLVIIFIFTLVQVVSSVLDNAGM